MYIRPRRSGVDHGWSTERNPYPWRGIMGARETTTKMPSVSNFFFLKRITRETERFLKVLDLRKRTRSDRFYSNNVSSFRITRSIGVVIQEAKFPRLTNRFFEKTLSSYN